MTTDGAEAEDGPDGGDGALSPDGTAELPVLPLRDVVPVPGGVLPLAVGQARSVELVDDVVRGDGRLVLVASRDATVEAPGPDELHPVGTVGHVVRRLRAPDGTLRVLVQARGRVRITDYVRTEPYLVAHVVGAPDVARDPDDPEVAALVRAVRDAFGRIVEAEPYLSEDLVQSAAAEDDPADLAHLVVGSLRLPTHEKQRLLEEVDALDRLRRLVDVLASESEVVSIGSRIRSEVQSELDAGQREHVLRRQLKAIREELGEHDPLEAEVDELREQLEALDLPPTAQRQAERELRRLEATPQASAEHGVIRTYLEWIASMPWHERTRDDLDLARARRILDEDHHGLDDVKDRILELLAVRRLRPDARGAILCLVGPPGVGKTSLGRSIARAMGRNFERVSAGGVRDEAEIRGHRRTYIGAMPGTVVRAVRDAGSNNPLLLVDEIDKVAASFGGGTSGVHSALLEVLDPEQNATFRDHYLDVPFDLSRAMFVTTANALDAVPAALRDRMEVVELPGYTTEQKLEIARRHLVPRQLDRAGLRRSSFAFGEPALRLVVEGHTREAGVRTLEREIGRIVRKLALEIVQDEQAGRDPETTASGRPKRVSVSARRVEELLGRPKLARDAHRRARHPGIATGLAWTSVGGDVLVVEAAAMPNGGALPTLTITGQLGDVMTESVRAALTWIRGNVEAVGADLPEDWFARHDVHVHVPAGATPKDGPSAGVTVAVALASLITGRTVDPDVALTGEVTLSGDVLPVGGLTEKALAAARAGLTTVVAPRGNEADEDELPPEVRDHVRFVWADRVEDALAAALPR